MAQHRPKEEPMFTSPMIGELATTRRTELIAAADAERLAQRHATRAAPRLDPPRPDGSAASGCGGPPNRHIRDGGPDHAATESRNPDLGRAAVEGTERDQVVTTWAEPPSLTDPTAAGLSQTPPNLGTAFGEIGTVHRSSLADGCLPCRSARIREGQAHACSSRMRRHQVPR